MPTEPALPSDEALRLETLSALQLERLQPNFERAAAIARTITGARNALVGLMRADGLWRAGISQDDQRVVPRGGTMTDELLTSRAPLWVEDARLDPRFEASPYVTGEPQIRFYAGAPILHGGVCLGALYVYDRATRPLDAEAFARLVDLADMVAQECAAERTRLDLADAEAEAREALEATRRSEQRLKLALEIGQLNMWEMDYRRRELSGENANAVVKSDGASFERMEANIWYGVHPADQPAAKALWREHVKFGTPFRAEYRMLQKNGPHIWVQSASEAIKDENGEIERVVGVLRSIDKAKRSEQALTRARDAAEAANRAKSEFLANMSHEIRTPLNGVMGVASALGRTNLTDDQREMVGLIESSAQTLESLLSDVLDLARIESGQMALKAEPFDLAHSVSDVAALFQASAQAKGLDLVCRIEPSAHGAFEGDAARIRQILSNLVSNAVKFTEKGEVVVACAVEETEAGAARLAISVSDTGIGFDSEAGARLFDRFVQADGSITRRYGGTGLGLAISRSLAEAMGGGLEAASEPGRGSVFTLKVALPRCTGEAGEAAPEALTGGEDAAVDLSRLRVLLAEDHPTNRRVVELILGAVGVQLTCVEDGAEALDACAAQPFDLILMDMQMPVMDGLTAIRAIRRREEREGRARTLIYALTANAMPEHAAASHEAGADGHLTKPITADALFVAVEAAAALATGPAEESRARA